MVLDGERDESRGGWRERADKRDNVKHDSVVCVARHRHACFRVDDGHSSMGRSI